jgi:hypothetical protein
MLLVHLTRRSFAIQNAECISSGRRWYTIAFYLESSSVFNQHSGTVCDVLTVSGSSSICGSQWARLNNFQFCQKLFGLPTSCRLSRTTFGTVPHCTSNIFFKSSGWIGLGRSQVIPWVFVAFQVYLISLLFSVAQSVFVITTAWSSFVVH